MEDDPASSGPLMRKRHDNGDVSGFEQSDIDPSAEYTREHVHVVGNRPSGTERDENVDWFEYYRSKVETNLKEMTRDDWISTFLPCYAWLKYYQWKVNFPADLMAGLTVGIMIIPQSMSYAKLAGLPVQYGLYTGLVPIYAYAVYGTSRQLAVGPVALVSLLLSTGIPKVLGTGGPDPDSDAYQALYNSTVIQVSFLVGVIYILAGLCRAGFITIFLSHSVISGFTTGAAVVIGLTQIKYLVGYDIGRPDTVQEVFKALIANIDKFNYKTFLMGTFSIFMLMGFKYAGSANPKLKWLRAAGPLMLTVIAVILTVSCNLVDKGIPVVGHIPSGFPNVTVSQWTPIVDFSKLFSVVLSIAVVGFMESVAIAKQLASKNKYEINPSKELIGLGMANLLGGAFSAYPVAGSFSRSAVNNEAGARSGISGVVTATLVCIALLCLTPLFQKLPNNTLAAIVISGVIGLLDYDEAFHLWKVHKLDFVVWCTACFGVMFIGTEKGLYISIGLSLLVVVYESAHPPTSVLGRLPETNTYRNINLHPEAEIYDGIVIFRIDGPLYFASAQKFRDMISKAQLEAETDTARDQGKIKFVILDMSPVSQIDSTALHQLETIVDSYRLLGQEICFADTAHRVMDRLAAAGLTEKIGDHLFFPSLHDAVTYCLGEIDYDDREKAAAGDEKLVGSKMIDEESASLADSEYTA